MGFVVGCIEGREAGNPGVVDHAVESVEVRRHNVDHVLHRGGSVTSIAQPCAAAGVVDLGDHLLNASSPRSVTATCAPSSAKRCAVARPMPLAAPVISTTRPQPTAQCRQTCHDSSLRAQLLPSNRDIPSPPPAPRSGAGSGALGCRCFDPELAALPGLALRHRLSTVAAVDLQDGAGGEARRVRGEVERRADDLLGCPTRLSAVMPRAVAS